MKLNILPARRGYTWIKTGFRLFAMQPMAHFGFFVSFMLFLILLGSIPYIGNYLSMMALPALTLGMMAISNECVKHKRQAVLPGTPPPLFMAWLTLRRSFRSLFMLGLWFALSFSVVLLIGATQDGGAFADLYLQGARGVNPDTMQKNDFRSALLITMLLYIPLAAMFWFAPALMNWKEMPLSKSLFLSLYAIYKNWRAFSVYLLIWVGIFMTLSAALLLGATMVFGDAGIGFMVMPLMLFLSTLFMSSIFPTFIDCFEHNNAEPEQQT